MAETIRMPKNGLTMREGTIAKIFVTKGAAVKRDDLLMEYETDKITGQINAPIDGFVLDIYAAEGDTVEILKPLCLIGGRDELAVEAYQEGPKNVTQPAENEHGTEGPRADAVQLAAVSASRPFSSPLAKKLAREYGLDISLIKGSGPSGRIVKKDIEHALELPKAAAAQPNRREDVPETYAAQAIPVAYAAGARREKMSAMRRAIAGRLQQSKQTIPHVYFKCEVDATSLMGLKNAFSPAMQKKYGQKLSVNDIMLAATAAALKEFPVFSAHVEADEIVYMDTVHLGVAVSLENGLIVPVIRSAEKLSLAALAMEAAKLAGKARAGQLTTEEITGGTFTVSNLGGFGMEEFFAIINPPESGILAVGAAVEKPIVIDHAVTIRPMMKLCLSVDHRLIDGAVAAAFMKRLAKILENADQLLI